MRTIHINEPELFCLELFRVALSEATPEAGARAMDVARHEVVSLSLRNFSFGKEKSEGNIRYAEFVEWVAKTSGERYEAAHEFSEIYRRYEAKNERKLNVAEHIGKRVWLSIQDQRFQGLYAKCNIFEQVGVDARKHRIHGARDKDMLRKIWTS